MTFSDFLKMLHKYLSSGKAPAPFVGELLNRAVNEDCKGILLGDDAYRKYYTGVNPISKKIASVIVSNRNQERFIEFLNTLIVSEGIISDLCANFEKFDNCDDLLVDTNPKGKAEFVLSLWEQFYLFIEKTNRTYVEDNWKTDITECSRERVAGVEKDCIAVLNDVVDVDISVTDVFQSVSKQFNKITNSSLNDSARRFNKMARLIIVAGASGAGKSYLLEQLNRLYKEIKPIQKLTTRPSRKTEPENAALDLLFSQSDNEVQDCDYTYNYCSHNYGIKKCDIDTVLNTGVFPIVIVARCDAIEKIKADYKDALVLYVQNVLSGNDLEQVLADRNDPIGVTERVNRQKDSLNDYIRHIKKTYLIMF